MLVECLGRSHAVYRVSVGGSPRFVVKTFGPRRGASDGLAAREAAVLRLAETCPELAAICAPRWRWDGADGLTATAAVGGCAAWLLDEGGGGDRAVGAALILLADALAAPLAAMHRATRWMARDGPPDPALAPDAPWGLKLMDGDAAPELWAHPACGALLAQAAADEALVAGLRTARARWRSLCLIHADLKHDNLLVEEANARLTVRVVDWEMARVGDPAWDVAAIAARLPVARADAPWPDDDLAAAAALIARYAAASGLKAAGLAERLIRYTGALMLMLALQHGSALPAGADLAEARGMVMKARSIFRRADALTQALIARC